jgi:hypothetical protein
MENKEYENYETAKTTERRITKGKNYRTANNKATKTTERRRTKMRKLLNSVVISK